MGKKHFCRFDNSENICDERFLLLGGLKDLKKLFVGVIEAAETIGAFGHQDSREVSSSIEILTSDSSVDSVGALLNEKDYHNKFFHEWRNF